MLSKCESCGKITTLPLIEKTREKGAKQKVCLKCHEEETNLNFGNWHKAKEVLRINRKI